RAATLAEQAVGPMFAENEMAGSASDVVRKLGEDAVYRQAFQKVYGGPVTMEFVVDAIVAYEMSVYVIDTPFDRYSAGDASALTPAAQRGMALFRDKARCAECHAGINFTDEDFHVLGVSNQQGRAVVTGKDKDVGAYKTPSLRNVALTAPYMHDGSVATLEEVIELYDRGGNARENLDKRMTRLNLTAQEKADLVAFMHSLTGTLIDLDGRPFSSSGLPQ
ncbi:MAG: cytochrome c peroxidase, partial [Myxococcota bacterium]